MKWQKRGGRGWGAALMQVWLFGEGAPFAQHAKEAYRRFFCILLLFSERSSILVFVGLGAGDGEGSLAARRNGSVFERNDAKHFSVPGVSGRGRDSYF